MSTATTRYGGNASKIHAVAWEAASAPGFIENRARYGGSTRPRPYHIFGLQFSNAIEGLKDLCFMLIYCPLELNCAHLVASEQ